MSTAWQPAGAAGATGLIVFYGSLMRGMGGQEQVPVRAGSLRFLRPCRLSGRLLDLGDWPGWVPGDGTVAAELHAIEDAAVLARLDRFEDFDPERPRSSLFLRRLHVLDRGEYAWLYEYNGPASDRPLVEGGDWRRYVGLRG